MTTRRALHFVFKVANRKGTINFYRNVLGMKVSCFVSILYLLLGHDPVGQNSDFTEIGAFLDKYKC